jgi:hypothetical protein
MVRGEFRQPVLYLSQDEYEYEQQEQPKQTTIPFYGYVRGAARLTLLASTSLSLAYIARLFPVLIPAYIALLVSAIAGTLIGVLFTQKQALFLVLFAIVAISTIAGYWDAIYAVFQIPHQDGWLWQATILVAAILAVLLLERAIKFSRKEEY